MLQNTIKQVIKADGATQIVTNAVLPKLWTSGYVNLHPIRNLYLISKYPWDLNLNGCQRRMGHPKEDPRKRRLQSMDLRPDRIRYGLLGL